MIQRLLHTVMPPDERDFDDDSGEITRLLRQWLSGEATARSELIVLFHPEPRRIAEIRLQRKRRDHTLQPTALLNDLFPRLVRYDNLHWQDRAHFMAVASRAMLNLPTSPA